MQRHDQALILKLAERRTADHPGHVPLQDHQGRHHGLLEAGRHRSLHCHQGIQAPVSGRSTSPHSTDYWDSDEAGPYVDEIEVFRDHRQSVARTNALISGRCPHDRQPRPKGRCSQVEASEWQSKSSRCNVRFLRGYRDRARTVELCRAAIRTSISSPRPEAPACAATGSCKWSRRVSATSARTIRSDLPTAHRGAKEVEGRH